MILNVYTIPGSTAGINSIVIVRVADTEAFCEHLTMLRFARFLNEEFGWDD